MRKLVVGSALLAALIGLSLLAYQTPSQTLGRIFILGVAAAIGAAYIGYQLIRQRRLHTWNRAAARIDSCLKVGGVDEGSQEYLCTYLYSVNGTQQGGSFKFLDRPGRLEEIRAALVGLTISVMYNPGDVSQSIVEESRIKGWDVA
jgi:hypothetical protein